MTDKQDLGNSMVAAINSDNAVAIASDAAELAIDSVLQDGLLRDVPIVGTLVSLTKLGFSVRDRVFVKKLVQFLAGLKSIPCEQRFGMVAKLEDDPDYGRRVGDHLIEILERLDSHRKPQMTAKVFGAYATGKIDVPTFNRLNHAIDRLPYYQIDAVRKCTEIWDAYGTEKDQKGIEAPLWTLQTLHAADLMKALSAWDGLVYQPNDLARIFLELELDKAPN